MSFEFAIEALNLGKSYDLFDRESDRLKQLLWGRWLRPNKRYYREFRALEDVSFAIAPSEVFGIVGRNGAGKSTLLQMVCGTLLPSAGVLQVRGKVAALLELGAGFNPDFSGLENIYMNAAILGLSRAQVDARLDDIVSFAGIGDFIRQPVKTYSSGMFVRLAFSVATSVEPDILVIDEALSVGDGAFARKSFDRIMQLKDAGKTILFCSHSMYQIEALCSRAMWIESGKLRMIGSSAEVTNAYQASLNASVSAAAVLPAEKEVSINAGPIIGTPAGAGRITRIYGSANGKLGQELDLICGETDLQITLEFAIDLTLPIPSVAFVISDANSLTVASVGSANDGIQLRINTHGQGQAMVTFPKLPLLKGRYIVTAYLACENAVHFYEQIDRCLVLNMTQKGLEQGLVTLPHKWES